MNFSGIFTLLACLSLPLLRQCDALMLVAAGSFIGTFALGSEEGFHVLPGPLLALCYCGWLGLKAIQRGRWHVPEFKGKASLVPFLAYAALLTIAAPFIFGGRISVIQPGLVSEGVREAVPLQFSSSSVAQLSYLVFDAILVCAAAQSARQSGFSIGRPVRIHLIIASVLAGLVTLETGLDAVGLPVDFFSFVMGSSLGEPRADRYALAGVFGVAIRRAQAIFGEPSYFSAYMTGICGAALVQARAMPRTGNLLRLLVIVLGLLVSFSTTAMVGLAVVAAVAAFVPLGRDSGSQLVRRLKARNRRWFVIVAAVAAIAVVVAVFQSDAFFDFVFGKLTNVDGYEDGNYSSGAERLFWDLTAAQALWDSFGIGIGAGATRASSFILNFGAAYGLIGVVLLSALVVVLGRALYRSARHADDGNLRAALVMWIGWFIGLAFSVPDGVSFFYVWIMLGFILATLSIRTRAAGSRSDATEGVPEGLKA